MMIEPMITLYEALGFGLIIAWPSGIKVSNQTGGTACLHPAIEGVYVPLKNDYHPDTSGISSPENELTLHFEGPKHAGTGAALGIDEEDAQLIDSVLDSYGLFPVLAVDRDRLDASHEAWIHVVVSADDPVWPSPQFVGFGPYPRRGILTWSNSD